MAKGQQGMSFVNAIDAVAWIAAGMALGALYFSLLYQAVCRLVVHAAAIRAMSLYCIRVILTIIAFWVIAQQGAMPLLLALFGFVLARIFVQRAVGSA